MSAIFSQSLPVFIVLTAAFGICAWLSGQAMANGWRPLWVSLFAVCASRRKPAGFPGFRTFFDIFLCDRLVCLSQTPGRSHGFAISVALSARWVDRVARATGLALVEACRQRGDPLGLWGAVTCREIKRRLHP